MTLYLWYSHQLQKAKSFLILTLFLNLYLNLHKTVKMIAKIDEPYSFLDDYSEGAHPRLLEALLRTNSTQQTGYGTDEYTQHARQLLLSQLQATEEDVSIHYCLLY